MDEDQFKKLVDRVDKIELAVIAIFFSLLFVIVFIGIIAWEK